MQETTRTYTIIICKFSNVKTVLQKNSYHYKIDSSSLTCFFHMNQPFLGK